MSERSQSTEAPNDDAELIDFRCSPDRYRHWKLSTDGSVATLALDVDEQGGLRPGYELKRNSYDLGVDIELFDAVQRLRFEHPEVGAVIVTSAKDRVFSAGANIRMLGQSSHPHKVNFCKFTNETRLAMEDANDHSRQRYLCAINGPAAGGGYELALATDYVLMVDDGSTAVSLPEVALLAVLPGTGGLTRLTDKRKVRRDRADFFCSVEEGVRGKRAVEWRLVDEVTPSSRFRETVAERARELAESSDRPPEETGIRLEPLAREITKDRIRYQFVVANLDRERRLAEVTISGPTKSPPEDAAGIVARGDEFWTLSVAREFDDLLLHLRHNEYEIGTIVLRTQGDLDLVDAYDALLHRNQSHWLAREILLYWKRTMRRLELTSKSLIALVEPGSCFAGSLLEIALAADRSYMLDGQREGDDSPAPRLRLNELNFGPFSTTAGITRIEARYLDHPKGVSRARQESGRDLEAADATRLRLVTFTPDDLDWEDEVRLALEERAGFSPDALTGMESSLRFPGPETMETKIFGRLSAWQNWIFQRPNAIGEAGSLTRFGTGLRAKFDRRRV